MCSSKASFQMQHMIFEILRQAQDDSVWDAGASRLLGLSPRCKSCLNACRAPALPHGTIRSFHIARKTWRIHQYGSLHSLSQRSAQLRQAGGIPGKALGDVHVFGGGTGDPFGMADVAQKAQTGAGNRRLARQGHHWHTHPERLAGRRPAVVGKGIQSHIDLLEESQERRPRRGPGDQLEPVGRDPLRPEPLAHPALSLPSRTMEQQPGTFNGPQDGRPQSKDALVDFAEVIQ